VVMVTMMVPRERHSGSADGEGQGGDSGHDPPACSGQHRVIPFSVEYPRITARACFEMDDLRRF
jgi:hypothetical protein